MQRVGLVGLLKMELPGRDPVLLCDGGFTSAVLSQGSSADLRDLRSRAPPFHSPNT